MTMKTKALILVFLLTVAIGFQIRAQISVDELLDNTGEYISAGTNEDIDLARSYFNDANELMEEIRLEEPRIEKFFEKKKKKGERKSVGLKIARVEATKLYQQGFELIYYLISNSITGLDYEFEEDKAMVNSLSDEATELVSSAKSKITPYEDLSNREYKKEVDYYSLVSELNYANQLWMDAINKQKQAFAIHQAQEEKKKREVADINAWQTAISENSLSAYKNYLFNFPQGKHREEAEEKIKELEKQQELEAQRLREAEERKADSLSQAEKLLYRIQLIAVSKPLDDNAVKELYPGDEKVLERKENGLYKYTIGKFDSFKAAKAYRDKLNVESFIVAFDRGERIRLVDAIAQEKNSP